MKNNQINEGPYRAFKSAVDHAGDITDKSGRNSLQMLGELKVAKMSFDDKLFYAKMVIRYFEEKGNRRMSSSRLTHILFFVHISRIPRKLIENYLYKKVLEGFSTPSEIEQRAIILQWINKDIAYFSPSDMRHEKEVRSKFPWHWIDAVINHDWDLANEEIEYQLGLSSKIGDLMIRLPSMYYARGRDFMDRKVFHWTAVSYITPGRMLHSWLRRSKKSNFETTIQI